MWCLGMGVVDANKSGGLDHFELATGLKTVNKQMINDKEIEYAHTHARRAC